METEILNQLMWIKWLLIVIVAAIVFGAIGIVILARVFVKLPEQIKGDISFPDRARMLLDQGKPEEVISLSENRISKFPADSHAHWFLGQACYRAGDLRRALMCLRKTQELQPEWESSYTGPLIRAIEERLAEGSSKAELKVITSHPAFEKAAPPNGDVPFNS